MTDHTRQTSRGPDRRQVIAGLGAGMTFSATGALAQVAGPLAALPGTAEGYLFFDATEARAAEALVDRIIPAEGAGPGALEAGCARFLDRALRAAWGEGDGQFLDGPYAQGTAQQGYQMPLTPAQLYRTALADIDAWARAAYGTDFADLPEGTQDDALALMETGELALARIPAALFFPTLLFDVKAGYFADPIHGGNRDMGGWKLVNFPGAYTDLRPFLGRTDPVVIEPVPLRDVIDVSAAPDQEN